MATLQPVLCGMAQGAEFEKKNIEKERDASQDKERKNFPQALFSSFPLLCLLQKK